MKKIFTFFAAVLTSASLLAADPTTTLDVLDAIESEEFVSLDLTANGPKSETYVGYNSSGSGSNAAFMDGTSRWKLSSSRTISFKVTHCDSVALNAYFTKDATTSVKYAIGSGEAVEFMTNGSDKKCEKVAGFKTNDADEIIITISSSNDLLLGVIKFFPAGTPSTDPVLNVDKNEVSFALTAAKTLDSAVVKFTGKNLAAGNYALNVPNVAGLTVNPTSVTVGEDGKLNAQVTIAYTSAVDVPAASTAISLTIGELSKSVSINYSATMAIQYIQHSLNIEQLVMDNGKSYDIQAALAANNIEFANLNALDSLNNSKGAGRNEAYLGLKIKTAGGYIAGWLQAGQTARVKFGFVDKPVKVTIGGMELTVPADSLANPVEFTAPVDTYVKFTTTSGNTVVIKQLMINEPIATLMYPITYQAAENGSVSGWKIAFPNETVQLTVTPAEGYLCTSLAWNNNPLHDEVEGQPITFTMPAEEVEVVAAFDTDFPTAIENGEAETKAAKFMENGQLMIRKNGVVYNAQGAVVK